ncbi:hypothetical protein L1987_39964 [Smallanthus sonchifolius]|uniref:Uncharacterized protein n=1 Tax=Smallanthus sonchifolius TaxID=185202 RepID=A0ACB9GSE0_9ASTR|nr:hypothetical protein L1987_39964 [Smallanthus sonchifolius]
MITSLFGLLHCRSEIHPEIVDLKVADLNAPISALQSSSRRKEQLICHDSRRILKFWSKVSIKIRRKDQLSTYSLLDALMVQVEAA